MVVNKHKWFAWYVGKSKAQGPRMCVSEHGCDKLITDILNNGLFSR